MSEPQTSFVFKTPAAPQDDPLSVVRFEGTEGISRLFEFTIELKSRSEEVDVDRLLQQPASLDIRVGGDSRRINGELIDFDVIGRQGDFILYRTTLVPRLWNLTQYRSNEVHVDETVREIIISVLEHSGFTSLDYELRLDRDYDRWPMCCQFDETHLNFLSRLMEREGIYYFFEHDDEGDRVIFCDYAQGQDELEESTLTFQAPTGMEVVGFPDTIHSLLCRQKRLPRRVLLKDYNDENPSVNIHGEAEVDPSGVGEVYDYGGHVTSPEEGRFLAGIRAEALLSEKRQYHGEGSVVRLMPGFLVNMEGHFRESFNRGYQVVSVEHQGQQPGLMTSESGQSGGYSNGFTLIETDYQFRPPRTTEKPRFFGTMNAFIDSETDGEYAQVDGTGRYKVVLPFDRFKRKEAKASCWIRMAQPYAGEGEGMHFPLRKNSEVLLTFIGGDPDRPVISGAVPNHSKPSVVVDSNQTKNVIQTSHGNKLELEDRADCRRIKLYSPHKNSYMHLGAPNHDGCGLVVISEGMERKEILGGQKITVMTNESEEDEQKEADDAQNVNFPGVAVLVTDWVDLGDDMLGKWTYRVKKENDEKGEQSGDLPSVSKEQALYLPASGKRRLRFTPSDEFEGEREITYVAANEPFGKAGSRVDINRHVFKSSEEATWELNKEAQGEQKEQGLEFDAENNAFRVTAPWIAVTQATMPSSDSSESHWVFGKSELDEQLKLEELEEGHGVLLPRDTLIRLEVSESKEGLSGTGKLIFAPHAVAGEEVAVPEALKEEEKKETLVFRKEDIVNEQDLFLFNKRDPDNGLDQGDMSLLDEYSGNFMIERRKGDQYFWSVGRSYNHGHWPSYNVATSYVENHPADTKTHLTSVGLNREEEFDLLRQGGPELELKEELGSEDLEEEFGISDVVSDVEEDKLWVNKDFQNRYQYSSGVRIAVDEDVSDLFIKKGGKKVLIEYDDEGNKIHWIGADGEEKKWDEDGNLLFHSRDETDDKSVTTAWEMIGGSPRKISEETKKNGKTTSETWSDQTGNKLSKSVTSEDAGGRKTETTAWDPLNKGITSFKSGNSGHGEQGFEATFTARKNMSIAFGVKHEHEIGLSASVKNSITVGASEEKSISVSASSKMGLVLGASLEMGFKLSAVQKFDFSHGTWLEIKGSSGLKVEITLAAAGEVKAGKKAFEIDIRATPNEAKVDAAKKKMKAEMKGVSLQSEAGITKLKTLGAELIT